MQIISLKCNSCGSDLQVNESTRFFNCSFCGSSLGLKRSGNAVYTEVLSEIKVDTEAILDTSEKLLLEKQVARLDRDWAKESESYDIEDLEENRSSMISLVVGMTIFMIIGFLFFRNFQNSSFGNNTPPILFIVPIVVFAFLIFVIASTFGDSSNIEKAKKEFESKKSAYEQKRNNLLNKIEEID